MAGIEGVRSSDPSHLHSHHEEPDEGRLVAKPFQLRERRAQIAGDNRRNAGAHRQRERASNDRGALAVASDSSTDAADDSAARLSLLDMQRSRVLDGIDSDLSTLRLEGRDLATDAVGWNISDLRESGNPSRLLADLVAQAYAEPEPSARPKAEVASRPADTPTAPSGIERHNDATGSPTSFQIPHKPGGEQHSLEFPLPETKPGDPRFGPLGVSQAWAERRQILMQDLYQEITPAALAYEQAGGNKFEYVERTLSTPTNALVGLAKLYGYEDVPRFIAERRDVIGFATTFEKPGLFEGPPPAGRLMVDDRDLAAMDAMFAADRTQVLIRDLGGGPLEEPSSGLALEKVAKYGANRYELMAKLDRAVMTVQREYMAALDAAAADPTRAAPGWVDVPMDAPAPVVPVQAGDTPAQYPFMGAPGQAPAPRKIFDIEVFSRAYLKQDPNHGSASKAAFVEMYGLGKGVWDPDRGPTYPGGGDTAVAAPTLHDTIRFEAEFPGGVTRKLLYSQDGFHSFGFQRENLNDPSRVHSGDAVLFDPTLGWAMHQDNVNHGVPWTEITIGVVATAFVGWAAGAAAPYLVGTQCLAPGAAVTTATVAEGVVAGVMGGAVSATVSSTVMGNFNWGAVRNGALLGAVTGAANAFASPEGPVAVQATSAFVPVAMDLAAGQDPQAALLSGVLAFAGRLGGAAIGGKPGAIGGAAFGAGAAAYLNGGDPAQAAYSTLVGQVTGTALQSATAATCTEPPLLDGSAANSENPDLGVKPLKPTPNEQAQAQAESDAMQDALGETQPQPPSPTGSPLASNGPDAGNVGEADGSPDGGASSVSGDGATSGTDGAGGPAGGPAGGQGSSDGAQNPGGLRALDPILHDDGTREITIVDREGRTVARAIEINGYRQFEISDGNGGWIPAPEQSGRIADGSTPAVAGPAAFALGVLGFLYFLSAGGGNRPGPIPAVSPNSGSGNSAPPAPIYSSDGRFRFDPAADGSGFGFLYQRVGEYPNGAPNWDRVDGHYWWGDLSLTSSFAKPSNGAPAGNSQVAGTTVIDEPSPDSQMTPPSEKPPETPATMPNPGHEGNEPSTPTGYGEGPQPDGEPVNEGYQSPEPLTVEDLIMESRHSRKLGTNMAGGLAQAQKWWDRNFEAHHIVPMEMFPELDGLRSDFDKWGIDFREDPVNGIWLPASVHRAIHTREYRDYLLRTFRDVRNADDARNALAQAKDDLFSGRYWSEKKAY